MISIRKIELEKNKIRKRCNCNGKGCPNCYGYCSYIDKLASANIPVDFWFRNIKNFYGDENLKKVVIDYIENINEKYDEGLTYVFVGERGRGKTFSSCSILKQALLPKNNYFSIYFTLSDIINNIVNLKSDIIQLSKFYDFVVIDEVDKRFFPTSASMELYGNKLENILRNRMQNRLPTIICSNSADLNQIFEGEFKKSFDSLFSQFATIIPVTGKDARKGKEKI